MRAVIVDDDEAMRMLVRQVMELEGDIEVVGEAANACEGARCWSETRPDVMIVDFRMPGHDGLDLAEHILREDPATRILMFSSFLNDAAVDRADAIGVSAIVRKDQVRRLPAVARGSGT